MNLNCEYCEHKNCCRLCKECKTRICKEIYCKDICGLICKNLTNIVKIKMFKTYDDEGFAELTEILPENCNTIYEFFLDGNEDAITGFRASFFESQYKLLPNNIEEMQLISQYELNEFSDEQDKFFKIMKTMKVSTYNNDGYETIWYVNKPKDFAAGYFLGANIYLIDKELVLNEHMGKNIYDTNDEIIKPNYTSIDLCVHSIKRS
jgi:hypothetical protein